MFLFVKRIILSCYSLFDKFKRTTFVVAFGQEMRLTSLNFPILEFRYFTSVRLDHLQRFFVYIQPTSLFHVWRLNTPWRGLIYFLKRVHGERRRTWVWMRAGGDNTEKPYDTYRDYSFEVCRATDW